ncbi:hypothetical protein F444_01520 [Phytophthora nicotianae P1976]|uniref:RxLR effector protein n=1 Tax=Phytophthora nicotianae P1976 TaxID=1317066 RepID=A0A081B0B4_PHYNI|nr:hypothetical protein F444_01520 [Phytophthora nicotianae P1976]
MRHSFGLWIIVILLACAAASVVDGAATPFWTPTTAGMNYEERRIAGSLKARASKVAEVARLKFWLFQKKSAADAFTALKLDQHMDDVLLSPKLNTLSTYVDMFNKKFPDSQVSLAGTLIAKYGDVAVAKALVRAKETSRSKDIASKLQTQQLEGWLNSHKSVEDVFT